LRIVGAGDAAHRSRGMSQIDFRTVSRSARARETALLCGVAAALVYVTTDLVAAASYPGYSFTDQAVSELFAIGAPTSRLVVPLFSLSSLFLLAFAGGIALSSDGSRALKLMALMFAASAIDALLLWNLFPMHMRGQERTFTDTMHLILSANPFVWITLIIGLVAFRNWFRGVTIAASVMVILPAFFAFRYAPALDAGQPTPGLGLAERSAQYAYQLWQVLLVVTLLRSAGTCRA
jgi:uncharacterized protein DUF998